MRSRALQAVGVPVAVCPDSRLLAHAGSKVRTRPSLFFYFIFYIFHPTQQPYKHRHSLHILTNASLGMGGSPLTRRLMVGGRTRQGWAVEDWGESPPHEREKRASRYCSVFGMKI